MTKGLAVVTGASAGIGWEMAKQLATRGYDLLLVARREERLKQLAGDIEARGQAKAGILKLDLTVRAERQQLVSSIALEPDRFSLLINNAGFGAARPAVDIAAARCLEMIELNVSALTELSLEAAKILTRKRSGGIINVASTAAFQSVPYMSVYAATKAYVLSFTEALAEELGGSGVRVMALCPGYTETEFQQVAGERAESARTRPRMSAADCVRIGLHDFEAGKRISITGISNKLQTFASWLFPRSLVVHLAAAMVKSRIS
ncbi:MAG: SDR family oxidoreductase [Acidobacteriia bacterium]|nr:SDR family oxidoreductase [Terriglobia bacterium]